MKGYGFLPLAKNICKDASKNLRGKCNQKLLDHANKTVTDSLKTSSKE